MPKWFIYAENHKGQRAAVSGPYKTRKLAEAQIFAAQRVASQKLPVTNTARAWGVTGVVRDQTQGALQRLGCQLPLTSQDVWL